MKWITECKEAKATEYQKKLEAQRLNALEQAVQKWGTEIQRAKFAEGFMPAEEVLRLVVAHVFEDVEKLAHYEKLTSDSLNHNCSEPDVSFDTSPATALSDVQYERLVEIRACAPEGAVVEPRIHTAACLTLGCDAPTVQVATALVTLDWNGYKLHREYSLGVVEA